VFYKVVEDFEVKKADIVPDICGIRFRQERVVGDGVIL
jgi:hypothetical protein